MRYPMGTENLFCKLHTDKHILIIVSLSLAIILCYYSRQIHICRIVIWHLAFGIWNFKIGGESMDYHAALALALPLGVGIAALGSGIGLGKRLVRQWKLPVDNRRRNRGDFSSANVPRPFSDPSQNCPVGREVAALILRKFRTRRHLSEQWKIAECERSSIVNSEAGDAVPFRGAMRIEIGLSGILALIIGSVRAERSFGATRLALKHGLRSFTSRIQASLSTPAAKLN